tara:strand:- start:1039 stop:1260 length:222 start_codon:yes stop_codon:yes gene_type:complete
MFFEGLIFCIFNIILFDFFSCNETLLFDGLILALIAALERKGLLVSETKSTEKARSVVLKFLLQVSKVTACPK